MNQPTANERVEALCAALSFEEKGELSASPPSDCNNINNDEDETMPCSISAPEEPKEESLVDEEAPVEKEEAPTVLPKPSAQHLYHAESSSCSSEEEDYDGNKSEDSLSIADCHLESVCVDPNKKTVEHDVESLLETNEPHPSLEYPPLYFGLKRFCPGFMERIKKGYQWRWSISYPLQKRVKGSKLLRYLRIYLTYGEILLLLPLLALAIWCIVVMILNPSVTDSGKACRLAVVAALLFGQKNSYLTMVLGVPFDRAVVYHKMSGYIAVTTGLLHGVACMLDQTGTVFSAKSWTMLGEGSMNFSGTVILVFMLLLFTTSLPVIRKKMFEVFYYCHLILLIGIIGGTAVHTGIMVPLIVFCTTGIDFLIRKVFMARYRYPNTAALRQISETVVEVSFHKTKGFDYNPGQYIYIAIPELSHFEWHPFSISTAPHQTEVKLHIRKAGTWTSALHDLAQRKSHVNILMEGPYGNFGVDVMSEKRYKCVLLLSGGVGLSPMQSMFNHLLHEQLDGTREMKKLKFVWIQRDPELMAQAAITDTTATLHRSSTLRFEQYDLEAPQEQEFTEHNCESLASMILGGVPAGEETDRELEEHYNSFDLLDDSLSDNQGPQPWFETPNEASDVEKADDDTTIAFETPSAASSSNSETPPKRKPVLAELDDVLDIDIHLTSDTDTHMPFVQKGRPDLASTFVSLREQARRLGEKRVAVCVCGPKRISYLSRKACIQLSDDKVRFDYHEESFGG